MFNSQQGDVSLYGNNEVQGDAHTADLHVDKTPDENEMSSGEKDKSAMDGVKSSAESHIEEKHLHIQPSDNLHNEVNPVDRNLDDEMMDMESELNNPPNVATSKLVDYQSTSEPDRE